MWFDEFETPIGRLTVALADDGIRRILFENNRYGADQKTWRRDAGAAHEAREQLLAYFAGERKTFDLPLQPDGTSFQLTVWKALREIPFGATRSYRDIAERIGKPSAMRAVGAANGRNPIPIIVPCHRVIGADGSMTGFGGGLPVKQFLLMHEGIGSPVR